MADQASVQEATKLSVLQSIARARHLNVRGIAQGMQIRGGLLEAGASRGCKRIGTASMSYEVVYPEFA